MLCFISENIRGTTKRFSFKEVLWLIRLGMVSQLEMQTCQQIHHARWELPPLRRMMSFLPPDPLSSSLMINILGWQMRLCGVIGNIQDPAHAFLFLKIWSVSACMWCLYNFQSKDQIPTTFYISFPKNDQFFIQNWSISDYATRSCVFVALSGDCSLAGLYCPQYDRKRILLLADSLRRKCISCGSEELTLHRVFHRSSCISRLSRAGAHCSK